MELDDEEEWDEAVKEAVEAERVEVLLDVERSAGGKSGGRKSAGDASGMDNEN